MNYENLATIFSISLSCENSRASGFNLITILVPLSKPKLEASDTINSPEPSDTHATPSLPCFFVKTSTLSATIKLE